MKKVALLGCGTVGGGVAANRRLRERLQTRGAEAGLRVFLPSPRLCTDNAAMIALAGRHAFQAGERALPDDDAYSRAALH